MSPPSALGPAVLPLAYQEGRKQQETLGYANSIIIVDQQIPAINAEEDEDRRSMSDPLDALRALMASHSPPLDALVVPSEDNHQVTTSLPASFSHRILVLLAFKFEFVSWIFANMISLFAISLCTLCTNS